MGWVWFHKLASPPSAYRFARRLRPWLLWPAIVSIGWSALTLVTGSIWGCPMWGTYWAWVPRLTSELILLFLYFGYMALRASFDDLGRADRASAVLAIAGAVDIPIIKYSVVWWNSLHQGASLSLFGASSIAPSMITPLLLMMLAFLLFFGAVLCHGLSAEIVRRERNAHWLSELVA